MALFPDLDTDFTPQDALRVPIGVASPLWLAYSAAAGAGVAYWWMTRWTQPAHLEAFDWFAPKTLDAPELTPELTPEVAPESAAEAVAALAVTAPLNLAQPAAETAVEAPAEAAVEAAVEPISAAADAMVETVAELVEPAAEAVADTVAETEEAAAAAADDLTRLVGIGPRLAERLADLGVKSFKDIAAWTDEDLTRFDKTLDLKGRAVRDAWVAQARRFADA